MIQIKKNTLSFLSLASLAFTCLSCLSSPLAAAPLYWVGTDNNTTTGGSGTWNATNTNWSTSSVTPSNPGPWQTWIAGGGEDIANFGAGGTITVSGTVNVNQIGLTAATNFTGGTINLTGSGPHLYRTGGATFHISSGITGSNGFIVGGTGGTFIFSGTQKTFTGDISIPLLRIEAANNAPVGSIFTSTSTATALDLRANQQFAGLAVAGAVIRGTAGTSTLTLSRNDGTSSTFTGGINGATNIVNLVKSGNYTQIMGGNASSTSAGSTTVNAGILALSKTDGLDALGTGAVEVTGGTLRLDNNNQLAGSQNMILSGGTFALNGFDDSLGSISLTNSTSSILDFGSGGSTVLFSEFATGSGLLSVTNWDLLTGSFRVTSDPTAFLSQITFNGTGATSVNQGSYYEIRAVPEPGSVALVAMGLAALFYRRRRK